MRLEDVLQYLYRYGDLKVGTRTTYSGPGLAEIIDIDDRESGCIWVTVRDTVANRQVVKVISKEGT